MKNRRRVARCSTPVYLMKRKLSDPPARN